jgi:glycosyltransferase involved in cell wall biosynthesis
MNELITVIMPTYNRSFSFINKSILSVCHQTYRNIELIIIDDNSKENQDKFGISNHIRNNEWPINIIYIAHEANLGACKARNTGIIHSKSEYIGFLDDDDEFIIDKIEKQYNVIKNSNYGLVYCLSNNITLEKNTQDKSASVRKGINNNRKFKHLLMDNYIESTSVVLTKKSVLDDVGYFNEMLLSAQDVELWIRIARKYKVYGINEYLVNYYIHNNERISTNYTKKCQGLNMLNEIIFSNYKIPNKVKAVRLTKTLLVLV